MYTDAEATALIRLRYWQHLLNERLKAGEFNIPVHLAFGHEAAAVAMDVTMQPDDTLCLTHRNGAYNLARSKSIEGELAHYRLDAAAGRPAQMASMNLAMAGTAIAYSSSILGNNLAVGSGIAMHRKLVKRQGVVFVLTGDGAMEEGVFWESLIFARSHGLGLVVVVENNNFSLGSTIAERRCPIDLALVCAGLCVGHRRASGASLPGVKAALAAARAEAADGHPSLVELEIRTFNQHAGPTPGWAEDPRRIAIEDGLLLGDESNDPLVPLRLAIGAEKFDRLAEQIVQGTPLV
ncbi:MAG: thiamine pyrophosphate-dependent enzyme [Acidobacteriota bacterium]|nr:thiamine pyrophosphate-dependent enzyme [Acidobacteriota bacterium]